jgi:hypothetical protein
MIFARADFVNVPRIRRSKSSRTGKPSIPR